MSHTTRINGVSALSIEFVAKPQETYRLHSAIATAMERTLREVTGYSGCLVMISDQEARLVTVLTFWSGADRATRCAATTPWVQKLLSPFMDHCLRVQSLNAHCFGEVAQLGALAAQQNTACAPRVNEELALCVA